MRLLVSVANAADASAALSGGADVIDAKNPVAGALGAVSAEAFRDVYTTVAGRRLVTAAIGDATEEAAIERTASAFAAAGAALVKVGFAGITAARRIDALIRAAVRGARTGAADAYSTCGVVAVAYADEERVGSLAAGALVGIAARAGAAGVLLDTADKSGPGLPGLITPSALAQWVAGAHEAGLLVALAGKLTAEDFAFVRCTGADIAGVRGAACDSGRAGHVSSEKVALLRAWCRPAEAGHYVRR